MMRPQQFHNESKIRAKLRFCQGRVAISVFSRTIQPRVLSREQPGTQSNGRNRARISTMPRRGVLLVTYREYLRSPQWRRRREQRLKLDGYACQQCGTTSKQYRLEVHHLTYKRLGHERMEDLQTLCVLCHPIATSEQRRKRYAKRVLKVPDVKRKTPILANKEGHDGIQNIKLQDYRRRTPTHA